ncbi:toll/interleukin-1 receptor domain-containing protein [Dysgonomonas mossii]|uniref:toll/interleukin-1 receptor domain-containing protein n=1 Tax=Dysgonomonas mossii TaxID=163665 RepID=UPI003992AB7B
MSDKSKEQTLESISLTDSKPLVFISHDTRDAEIAEAFSKLLSSVSAGVLKTFRSSDNKGNQGIEYGVEWYPKIVDALQDASDVVCLLTENSINRPWILFEAGMAKGKLNTSILGVSIGVPLSNVNTGPFAQFQNCDDEEIALCKLVKQLVKKIPNSEPDDDVIQYQVQAFKAKISGILKAKPTASNVTKPKENKLDSDAAKLFEEVKIMFKELPSRIEMVSQKGNRESRKRMPPDIAYEEMYHFIGRKNHKLCIQMVLSPLRNDFPWIYDGTLECYDKISKTKSTMLAEKEIQEFMRIVELSFEHPILRDYMESNYRYKDYVRIIYDILMRSLHEKPNIPTT